MNNLKFLIPLFFIIELLFYQSFIPILRMIKINQIVRTDGPREHFKKNGTPTMGGLVFTIFILIF